MKIWHKVFTIFILAGLPAAVAHTDKLPQFGTHSRGQFQDYWYNRGAEISRFSLEQMRYGEIHQGDAVLVFVTGKMNPETQIKADHSGEQDIAILKLNFEKDFPYRIQKWHETYKGIIDKGAKVLATKAIRTHTIMDPYWRHHTNKDRRRLDALGLNAREMGSK